MSFIFISYCREDITYVSKLKQLLEDEHGLPVWFDNKIEEGRDWRPELDEKLEQCKVFLLVMSPSAYRSRNVQSELAFVLDRKSNKPIFPLLLEGERWPGIAAVQSTDVQGGALPPFSFFESLRKHFPNSIVATDGDNLRSVVFGKNYYTRLRDLLAAKNWRAADQETANCMCKLVGREENDYLRSGCLGETTNEIASIPREDLSAIDDLWIKYSRGHFGFSVQKQKWFACGNPGWNNQDWIRFGEILGWKKREQWFFWFLTSWKDYKDLTFAKASPEGHLPILNNLGRWKGDLCLLRGGLVSLFSQLPSSHSTELESECLSPRGTDFTRLDYLLRLNNWKEADIETNARMLDIVGRNRASWIRKEDYLKLPAADLKMINDLWIKHSKHHFGFSIQKRIFTHCGARLDGTYPGDRVWFQFCNDLGWSKNNNYVLYKEMDFSMSAPPGHLPHLCAAGFVPKSWEGYRFLLSREEI